MGRNNFINLDWPEGGGGSRNGRHNTTDQQPFSAGVEIPATPFTHTPALVQRIPNILSHQESAVQKGIIIIPIPLTARSAKREPALEKWYKMCSNLTCAIFNIMINIYF